MKILYTIPNPYGLGADRWIWEGYRDAFRDEGHEFFTLSEFDDFEKSVRDLMPDFFFLDFAFFITYVKRAGEVKEDFFREIKNNGVKIMCLAGVGAGLDKDEHNQFAADLWRRYMLYMDVCFTNTHSPQQTNIFEKKFGKKLYFIAHAANTKYYFPENPDQKFACDIAFVGSYYAQKKQVFDKLLLPLKKKYKVRIYGTGWTMGDKILRLGSGVARCLRFEVLARLINDQRITILSDDERRLYASAKICVNIHEYYNDGASKGLSNEREFKILASGGFELSDYCPGMERYFNFGKEIMVIRTPEEWFSAIDYYLRHDKERRKIQTAGTALVLGKHTYRHRVRQLINLYNSIK